VDKPLAKRLHSCNICNMIGKDFLDKHLEGKSEYYFATANSDSCGFANKKCPTSLAILRFEEFDFWFDYYFNPKKIFAESSKKINTKKYTVKDIDISSRVLNHWSKKKVLPKGAIVKGADWKTFSLVEVIWLNIVEEMRKFGISLEKIAKVESWIMQWDKNTGIYPWFEFYLFWAKATADDTYIIITQDGTAEMGTSYDLEKLKNVINGGISQHLLLISLKSILKKMQLDVVEIEPLFKLENTEKAMVEALRETDKKEITLRFKKGGLISEIETKKIYPDSMNGSEIKKEFEGVNPFGEAIMMFENGKAQSVGIIKRKRF
jgi:hypothetical protein